MKIGIDISQLAFPNTGVSNYIKNLVEWLSIIDKTNEYVLFYSSFRRPVPKIKIGPNFKIKAFKFPPSLLESVWNRAHIFNIESLIGNVDVFICSDWIQPPVRRAKKVVIIYDFIIYKYPNETHDRTEFNIKNLNISPNIVDVQKRTHKWIKKEADKIICISESTKRDAAQILNIPEEKLIVIQPGI